MVQRYCFSNFGQGYFNKYWYLNLLNIPNIYVYAYKTIQHANSYRILCHYGLISKKNINLVTDFSIILVTQGKLCLRQYVGITVTKLTCCNQDTEPAIISV